MIDDRRYNYIVNNRYNLLCYFNMDHRMSVNTFGPTCCVGTRLAVNPATSCHYCGVVRIDTTGISCSEAVSTTFVFTQGYLFKHAYNLAKASKDIC